MKDLGPKSEPHTEMIYLDGQYNPYIYNVCPGCGSTPIRVGNSCHTYEVHGKWMNCMDCGSAGWLYCENENCHWNYEWGLNPNNPRSASNEENRPSWLVGKWPY